MSSDLFVLSYGALVADLVNDLESPEEVNRQLDKIGFNMLINFFGSMTFHSIKGSKNG